MTRKRLLMIVTSILVLGGLFMFFNLNGETKEEYEAKLFRQEQENIARYLVNEYENIDSIEFDKLSKNGTTGSSTLYIYLNDTIYISVTYFGYGNDRYIEGFFANDNKLVQRQNFDQSLISLENINVTYMGESIND